MLQRLGLGMVRKLTCIVVGGGVGGLATSAALAQRGWDVTVLERYPELRAVGAGIRIWPCARRVLKAIDAYDEVSKVAFFGTHVENRDLHNNIISSREVDGDTRVISILRDALLRSLEHAAIRAGVHIRTRAEVVSANTQGDVFLATGEHLSADLVVGADGVWSSVRKSIGIETLHEQSPEAAFRAVIDRTESDTDPEDSHKYIENWNGPYRIVITPVSDSKTYLALAYPHQEKNVGAISIDKKLWRELFPHWSHLVDRVDPKHTTWGRYSYIRCKSWSTGRTAILGDAAHAQYPNLGYGGGMAMQNGLALATFMGKVSDERDISGALAKWESNEREFVEHCQKWASLYGEAVYLRDDVRTQVIAAALSNSWVVDQIRKVSMGYPTGGVD